MCPNINDNRHDDSDDRCPVMACSLQFAFQVRGCPDHAVEDTSTSSPCNHPMTMGKEYHFRIFQEKKPLAGPCGNVFLILLTRLPICNLRSVHLPSLKLPLFAENQWDWKMKVPFWGISRAFAVSFREFPTPQNLLVFVLLIPCSRPVGFSCLKDLQIGRKFPSRINKTRAKQNKWLKSVETLRPQGHLNQQTPSSMESILGFRLDKIRFDPCLEYIDDTLSIYQYFLYT